MQLHGTSSGSGSDNDDITDYNRSLYGNIDTSRDSSSSRLQSPSFSPYHTSRSSRQSGSSTSSPILPGYNGNVDVDERADDVYDEYNKTFHDNVNNYNNNNDDPDMIDDYNNEMYNNNNQQYHHRTDEVISPHHPSIASSTSQHQQHGAGINNNNIDDFSSSEIESYNR